MYSASEGPTCIARDHWGFYIFFGKCLESRKRGTLCFIQICFTVRLKMLQHRWQQLACFVPLPNPHCPCLKLSDLPSHVPIRKLQHVRYLHTTSQLALVETAHHNFHQWPCLNRTIKLFISRETKLEQLQGTIVRKSETLSPIYSCLTALAFLNSSASCCNEPFKHHPNVRKNNNALLPQKINFVSWIYLNQSSARMRHLSHREIYHRVVMACTELSYQRFVSFHSVL